MSWTNVQRLDRCERRGNDTGTNHENARRPMEFRQLTSGGSVGLPLKRRGKRRLNGVLVEVCRRPFEVIKGKLGGLAPTTGAIKISRLDQIRLVHVFECGLVFLNCCGK